MASPVVVSVHIVQLKTLYPLTNFSFPFLWPLATTILLCVFEFDLETSRKWTHTAHVFNVLKAHPRGNTIGFPLRRLGKIPLYGYTTLCSPKLSYMYASISATFWHWECCQMNTGETLLHKLLYKYPR
jgi:hypothetical protein